jgi:hypothetical protein
VLVGTKPPGAGGLDWGASTWGDICGEPWFEPVESFSVSWCRRMPGRASAEEAP